MACSDLADFVDLGWVELVDSARKTVGVFRLAVVGTEVWTSEVGCCLNASATTSTTTTFRTQLTQLRTNQRKTTPVEPTPQ
jgi:hypothetical protein